MMLDYLKENTEKMHREAENISLARHILDHSINNRVFEEFLIRNYLAYQLIEKKLILAKHIISEEVSPFITSNKSDQILLDLNGLTPCTLHLPKNQLPISTEVEAIGALYVIEGSMLGSCLINKHINRCDNLRIKGKQYFFNDNTQEIVKHWKSFTKTINQSTYAQSDKKKALISAQNTFLIFKHFYTIQL